MEQCVERGFELEALLDNGDEDVDRDGDPDLGFHRVFGCPEELLDPQMLLDPLEEQLDLPSALVKGADGHGRQTELIGEEHQGFFLTRHRATGCAAGVRGNAGWCSDRRAQWSDRR